MPFRLVASTDTIKIHLPATPGRPWCLQGKLLCHHSPYFRKLLDANATGDQTLDDISALDKAKYLDGPHPFELFVQWLYEGSIDEVPEKTSAEHPRHNLFTYIRLWILCDEDHFNVPDLQNLALQRMNDYYQKQSMAFTARHAEYIYNHTSKESNLRKVVIQGKYSQNVCNLRKILAQEAAHEFMRRTHFDSRVDNQSSFEYLSENIEFAVDVLHAIREGFDTSFPHPFAQVKDTKTPAFEDVVGEPGAPPPMTRSPTPRATPTGKQQDTPSPFDVVTPAAHDRLQRVMITPTKDGETIDVVPESLKPKKGFPFRLVGQSQPPAAAPKASASW